MQNLSNWWESADWHSVIPQKEHKSFQARIDFLGEEVADRMAAIRAQDDAVETLVYLRRLGISQKACIVLAKRIGEKMKQIEMLA